MKKFLPLAVFLVLMALVILWADTNTMPDVMRRVYRFPFGDKIGHLVIYGVFAYLLTAAMPFRRLQIGSFSLPLGIVIAVAFATLEEASQFWIARRTPELLDLLMGYLGIYASTWIPCVRENKMVE